MKLFKRKVATPIAIGAMGVMAMGTLAYAADEEPVSTQETKTVSWTMPEGSAYPQTLNGEIPCGEYRDVQTDVYPYGTEEEKAKTDSILADGKLTEGEDYDWVLSWSVKNTYGGDCPVVTEPEEPTETEIPPVTTPESPEDFKPYTVVVEWVAPEGTYITDGGHMAGTGWPQDRASTFAFDCGKVYIIQVDTYYIDSQEKEDQLNSLGDKLEFVGGHPEDEGLVESWVYVEKTTDACVTPEEPTTPVEPEQPTVAPESPVEEPQTEQTTVVEADVTVSQNEPQSTTHKVNEASDQKLADTGLNAGPMTAFGVAMLILGGAVLWAAKRRV